MNHRIRLATFEMNWTARLIMAALALMSLSLLTATAHAQSTSNQQFNPNSIDQSG